VPGNAPNSEKQRTAAVYLALGSNVGDRQANLHEALRLLNESGVSVVKSSSLYETEPVDYLDQDWFLNAAVKAQTQGDPLDLLQTLREIEKRMGSKKPFAKGPRLIDLDILLYDDQAIDLPELQVPHPRMLERRFVLVPLAEIAPDLRHPSWPGNVAEMLARTSDRSEVRKFVGGNTSR
jgi:2-amino-4-hydroxy-6-hydroxymethyldihydropteridine diphosphokinase